MVLPLIPVAIAGLGIGTGYGLGTIFGGESKKEIHAPQEYYAPVTSEVYSPVDARQLQFSPVTSYAYQGATTIIGSPGATSKKEQSLDVVSQPEQRGAWDFPLAVTQEPTHTPGDVSGLDLMPIVLIAVVGAVAITFIKGKKKGSVKK